MEEEIKVLEEFVKENRNWHCIECGYNCEKDMKTEQAIENLINKYKELEKERDDIYADYQDLGKEKLKLEEKCEEQEKMIELMALSISNYDSQLVINTFKDKEDVKEFFIKKAKGE